jgi:hypothetical protein
MKPASPNAEAPANARIDNESAVLRIAREALRADPPSVRFVPRDVRLPQL